MATDEFKDKQIFITGASKGIGYAIAQAFAANGAELHLNARDENLLREISTQLMAEYPVKVHTYPFDVSDEGAVKAFFQNYQKKHKAIDVLVNNAGQMNSALLMMTRSSDIQNMFSVNVFGSINCAQYATRIMARHKSGVVINLCSIVGENGFAGQTIYSATKAAMSGFTKSLARELAASHIRVNAIAPGMIETDLLLNLKEEKRSHAEKNISVGRVGLPSEVADLALFLASEKASYITGQVIAIDGGMSF